MSAFMVEDRTINRIVNTIEYYSRDNYYLKEGLKKLGFKLESVPGREELAHALFQLNIKSINTRYGKGEAKKFRPLDFKYSQVEWGKPIQTLKSLQCFTY